MLGNSRPAHIKIFSQRIDGTLFCTQQLQDLSPAGVCDGLEWVYMWLYHIGNAVNDVPVLRWQDNPQFPTGAAVANA